MMIVYSRKWDLTLCMQSDIACVLLAEICKNIFSKNRAVWIQFRGRHFVGPDLGIN